VAESGEMNASPQSFAPSRGWLIFGGIVSIIVGLLALATPTIFSYILTQLIGAFLLVSGVIGFFLAIFGSHQHHRFLSGLSGLVRIAAGASLFLFTLSGMAALTIILAAVFLSEGVVCIVTSIRMRPNPAWIWLFLNGIVALILGGMIYARWPADALWIVGVLYGIQSIFGGATLLMLGISGSKPAGA